VVGNVKVSIGLTLELHQYYLQNFLNFIPGINSLIHFNSMKFCKIIWMTFVTHTEDLRRKCQDIKIDVIEIVYGHHPVIGSSKHVK
jgi:hypothetical protein